MDIDAGEGTTDAGATVIAGGATDAYSTRSRWPRNGWFGS